MEPLTTKTVHAVNVLDEKSLDSQLDQVESTHTDAISIDFEEADPTNPLDWPAWKRWTIALSVASFNLLRYVGAT